MADSVLGSRFSANHSSKDPHVQIPFAQLCRQFYWTKLCQDEGWIFVIVCLLWLAGWWVGSWLVVWLGGGGGLVALCVGWLACWLVAILLVSLCGGSLLRCLTIPFSIRALHAAPNLKLTKAPGKKKPGGILNSLGTAMLKFWRKSMYSMISSEVPLFRFACFLASRGVALHPREREREQPRNPLQQRKSCPKPPPSSRCPCLSPNSTGPGKIGREPNIGGC